MMPVDIAFDRYYPYAELTDYLKQYAESYPNLASLSSIGKSHEGREIWAMAITNALTGEHSSKPALYVDGNIHAGEVTASVASLYLIDYLLRNYQTDSLVTRLLDSFTFYVLPRINPDGAELYLTTPELLRSSVRPFPAYRKSEDPPGLHAADIDGDGRILLMRIRDNLRGTWKVDSRDSRLMVERQPLDTEGPFYHIYSEGHILGEDGKVAREVKLPFAQVPTRYGLDINRNFPSGFSHDIPGSGEYPLSEPETSSQARFVTQHPNIGGALMYHTTGGIVFIPHRGMIARDFDKRDLFLYEALAQLGYEATGYPLVDSMRESFSGVFDEWCLDHRGIFSFTPELWNAESRATGKERGDLMRRQSASEKQELERKLLIWNDRELCGQGFIDWQEFEHPQLGKVEIGGWDTKNCRQNPPPSLLKGECHRLALFALSFAAALPKVSIDEVKVEKVAADVYAVEALIANHGYLPTNVTEHAVRRNIVRPDRVQLVPSQEIELLGCPAQVELGFLEGYALSQDVWGRYKSPAHQMKRVRWTLGTATQGAELTVRVLSERGGTVTRSIRLP